MAVVRTGWQSHQGRGEMTQGKGKGAGSSKKRYVWVVLSALLFVLLFAVSFQCVRLEGRLKEVKREREDLRVKLEAQKGGHVLRRGDISKLQKLGLADPAEDLASDLIQHRELIPYEGVMGGTMGFYSKKDIHVLTTRWILASFEDGHIGGCMLLEYQVSPEGEIQWNVLSAYLD